MLLDLPLRKKELEVEVENGAVILTMATLDDEAAGELYDHVESVPDGKGGQTGRLAPIPSYVLMRIFDRHVCGLRTKDGEAVRIAGAPFDAKNRDHVMSIHRSWKIQAVTQAAVEEFVLPEALQGNSIAPAGQ